MTDTRKRWIELMTRISYPVLDALSRDCLRREMPVESKTAREDRENYTYLEAFGRTLMGISPWLGSTAGDAEEEAARKKFADLARSGIEICVSPDARDRMNFSSGFQPIVDAAFLSEAILRAPHELWEPLSKTTKSRLLSALRQTRSRKPYRSNWLLFGAMTECMIRRAGGDWDPMRIDYAVAAMEGWYRGDGWYGDGEEFHLDYYGSYVIHPMMVEVLESVSGEYGDWDAALPRAWDRASHYASHLERMISPEGTYPPIGRSLTYRFGAFHMLALAAYRHKLEAPLSPAAVRCALDAVICRTAAHHDMFDGEGWLTVGITGHQPKIGEGYISTGSEYMCTAAFLPLGLPESDEFWSSPDEKWTSKKLWDGEDADCFHAIR
ncbi:MAG: DUF2264 domain-containing protein [Firmicutes bacterium]|nr:DUF2264 domain-containing protein [Bacillota bacterium]